MFFDLILLSGKAYLTGIFNIFRFNKLNVKESKILKIFYSFKRNGI